MCISKDEITDIRLRLPNYPQAAQDDINRLIACIKVGPKKQALDRANFSSAFERYWKKYPKKTGKIDAYQTMLQRISEGYTEEELIKCAELYLHEKRMSGTDNKYYLNLSTFFGPLKARFLDYLDTARLVPENEPDYWPEAKKLIRHMTPLERTQWRVPYPLPLKMDYERNFGRATE